MGEKKERRLQGRRFRETLPAYNQLFREPSGPVDPKK